MLRRLGKAFRAAGLAEVVAWILASLVVLYVVARHDAVVNAYWLKQDARNSLFLTKHQESPEFSAESARMRSVWVSIMRYEADFSVGLLAASAGVVLITATRRGKDRRRCGGPGAVACVSAVAAMGLCILEEASLAGKEGRGLWGRRSNPFPNAWPAFESWIGLAVLGAWTVLVGARLWRRRAGWADRVGVVIGTLWIGLLLYRITASIFIPFANWRY